MENNVFQDFLIIAPTPLPSAQLSGISPWFEETAQPGGQKTSIFSRKNRVLASCMRRAWEIDRIYDFRCEGVGIPT